MRIMDRGWENFEVHARKILHGDKWTRSMGSQRVAPCRATQDEWVTVESSDKTWSTGEGNGKPLQYSCLENPMNSMKR